MSISDKLMQIAENEQKVYDSGYSKGKQDNHDEFWDYLQNFGNKTDYGGTFLDWHEKIFYPKYDMKPHNAQNMFRIQRLTFDLVERLNECGVILDFSNCTNLGSTFHYAHMSRLPTIDTRMCDTLTQTFRYIYTCHTIDKVILRNDGTQKFTQTFDYLTDLENITIEGVIGHGFNVQWSTKLTHDSLMSIINALADYSADTSGTTWTVTLGSENIAKLTETELAIIEAKGWLYQ